MAPLARILLRVAAGFLVGWGWLGADDTHLLDDPELALLVESGLGALVWLLAEYWYAIAKRYGWKT